MAQNKAYDTQFCFGLLLNLVFNIKFAWLADEASERARLKGLDDNFLTLAASTHVFVMAITTSLICAGALCLKPNDLRMGKRLRAHNLSAGALGFLSYLAVANPNILPFAKMFYLQAALAVSMIATLASLIAGFRPQSRAARLLAFGVSRS